MRRWLLVILSVGVIAYAYTRRDDFRLDFVDPGIVLTGEVVLVIDGDTFDLQSGPVRHHVRLVGIDAPELGQTFGDHAKHYLLDMVESQTVRVEVRDRDQSGIILGELFVNQISINKLMLKDGYTWAIRGFRADRNLQGMEKFARVRSLGLWRDKDATSPWVYRKQLLESNKQLFQNDKN